MGQRVAHLCKRENARRHRVMIHRSACLLLAGLAAGLSAGCLLQDGLGPPASLELAFNIEPQEAEVEPAGATVHREQPVFEEVPGKVGHHAATITAFPDGGLLAAWYSYDGPEELDGSAIIMARRPAGADAWGVPWQHIDRPAGDGNPVLYSEGDAVWLFQAVVPFGWSTAHIEVQRSADRGVTWTAPKSLSGPLGSNVRCPPVRTQAGHLLLPAYDDLLPRSLFFTSPDGEDWTLQTAVYTAAPHYNIQPSVVRVGGGRLLAVMRNAGQGWLWVSASDDDGQTWSPPQNSGFPNPGSAAVILTLSNGHLVLIFNDSPTERRPLSVASSADEGRTWSAPRVLADGEEHYSYPAAVQTPDGLIHVLYSLNRRLIRHATISESWIVER